MHRYRVTAACCALLLSTAATAQESPRTDAAQSTAPRIVKADRAGTDGPTSPRPAANAARDPVWSDATGHMDVRSAKPNAAGSVAGEPSPNRTRPGGRPPGAPR